MQEESGFNPHPTFRPDATSRRLLNHARFSLFQSSSDLQAGCNHAGHNTKRREHMFQSSSDLQAGCNGASQVLVGSRSQFQSSSDLQAGCNRPRLAVRWSSQSRFNPHPTFRPDATPDRHRRHRLHNRVSILIRPSGRMQPDNSAHCDVFGPVSILIRPSGRMQLSRVAGLELPDAKRFNPHPTFRPDATRGVR